MTGSPAATAARARVLETMTGVYELFLAPRSTHVAEPHSPGTREGIIVAAGVVLITFGGGVNEVMRDMIATAGLGLPKAKR